MWSNLDDENINRAAEVCVLKPLFTKEAAQKYRLYKKMKNMYIYNMNTQSQDMGSQKQSIHS